MPCAKARRASWNEHENSGKAAAEQDDADHVHQFSHSFKKPSSAEQHGDNDALFFDKQLDDPTHHLNHAKRGSMSILTGSADRPPSPTQAEDQVAASGKTKRWGHSWFGKDMSGWGARRKISRQDSAENAMAGGAADGDGETPLARHGGFVDLHRARQRHAPGRLVDAAAVSCGLFSRDSRVRRACWRLHTARTSNTVFLLANVANSLAVAVAPDMRGKDETTFMLFDLACVVVLGVEVVAGVVALGGQWWTADFHKLDAFVLVASIVEFICAGFGITSFTLRPFRLVRIFRPLSRIAVFAEIRRIITTLREGLSQLATVFAMLVIFLAAFSIFGMAVFRGAFRRRCVTLPRAQRGVGCASDFSDGWAKRCTDPYTPGPVPRGVEAVSGGFPFFTLCQIFDPAELTEAQRAGYAFDPDGWTGDGLTRGVYHTCQQEQFQRGEGVTQTCVAGGNPGFGFKHFDHVGGAMLAVSQVAVPDAHYTVLHYSLESEPLWFYPTWGMYLLITCICTFLLLSLFVAVVTGTFKRLREEAEELERIAVPTVIRQGTSSSIELRANQVAPLPPEGHALPLSGAGLHSVRHSAVVTMRESMVDEDDVAFQLAVQRLLASEAWTHVSSLVIILHTIAMAQLAQGGRERDSEKWLYGCCSLVLMAETAMRFVAAGSPGVFWRSGFNRFECLMTALNLVGWLTGPRLFRFLPAFRLYRLMVYFPTLYALLLSTVEAVPAMLNLCFFILGIALCFAITGRYVVGSDMEAFASFRAAMLTVFQLLTGDSWSAVLYEAMASKSNADGQVFTCLLLLGWFVLSKLILANIFVSIIIENFDVSATIHSIRQPGRIAAFRAFVWNAAMFLRTRFLAFSPPDPLAHMPAETAQGARIQPTGYALLDHLRSHHAAVNLRESLLGSVATSVNSLSAGGMTHSSLVASTAQSSLLHPPRTLLPPEPLDVAEGGEQGAEEVEDGGERGASVSALVSPQLSSEPEDAERHVDDEAEPRDAGRQVVAPSGRQGQSEKEDEGTDLKRMVSVPVSGGRFGSGSEASESGDAGHAQPGKHDQDGGGRPANRQKKEGALGMVRAMTMKRMVRRSTQLEDPRQTVTEETVELPEATMCFMWLDHPVRRCSEWLEEWWLFNAMVGAAITASCLISVLEGAYDGTPVGSDPAIPTEVVSLIDSVSTGIFTAEFVAKLAAYGMFFTRDAYFKSGWNVVDFLVLLFAWGDVVGVAGVNGSAGKVFRLTRALRPLRVMKRNRGMRHVIDALFSTLAPVMYVVIFSISTIVVFSIIGQGLFAGRLKYCTRPGAEFPKGRLECAGLDVDVPTGVMYPRVWQNPSFHFDTVEASLLTLFRVNTVKYVGIMQTTMDMTGIDQSPSHNHSASSSAFFVTYLVVGALFVWNLFVGFIVDGFHFIKGKSATDRRFEHFLRQLRNHRPTLVHWKRPKNRLSVLIREVVDSDRFQMMSMLCVLCNVAFMLADHRDADPRFQLAVEIQNVVFCTELTLEVMLFTIGHGFGGFISDPWKGFDLFIAVGTLAGLLTSNPQISQPANAFRLLRVLRLMTLIRPIRIILETLLASLPQLANILLLLVLIYSMFAVVAVQAFGTTRFGHRLGPTANFQTWAAAMRVCYQMVVGDEWQDIMVDASVRPPLCTEVFDPALVDHYQGAAMTFGDCGTRYSQVFFILFKLLGEAVMLNLFIGMILDNFSYITDDVVEIEDDNWTNGASGEQIMEMVRVFRHFDAGTGYLPLTAYRSLALELPTPLGFRHAVFMDVSYGRVERAVEKLILAELHLCVRQDRQTSQELVERWWTKWWSKLVRAVAGAPTSRFCQAVRFEELMLTMLYWRKPEMVPDAIKMARQDKIQEVILMTYAITLKNFFNRLVAKRKKHRVRQGLEKLITKPSGDGEGGASFTGSSDPDSHHTETRRIDRIEVSTEPASESANAMLDA